MPGPPARPRGEGARGLRRGGTLSELTPIAYDDTPAVMLPAAERSCLASLEKLRAEGRARLEGGRWSVAR